jgi:hypothetical protein
MSCCRSVDKQNKFANCPKNKIQAPKIVRLSFIHCTTLEPSLKLELDKGSMGNNISASPIPSPTPHHNPKLASFESKSSLAQREHSTNRRPRILCLDGGGMRGIIEAEFLKEIEKRSGKKVNSFTHECMLTY